MSIFLSWIKQQDLAVVILYKQYNRTYCKGWEKDYKVSFCSCVLSFHASFFQPCLLWYSLFAQLFSLLGRKFILLWLTTFLVVCDFWRQYRYNLFSLLNWKSLYIYHYLWSAHHYNASRLRTRPGGGTLWISGWGCAARTLEPLTYTRASSAEFCYPMLE